MKDILASNQSVISECYREHNSRIISYIQSRVGDRADAENIAQDAWLRLLETPKAIIADTIVPLIYRVASNLIIDHFRRRNRCAEQPADVREYENCIACENESEMHAHEIRRIEMARVECLPRQRRIIYMMSRYQDKAAADIAAELSLSCRTVENHLRLGRHDVRSYVAAAIS